MLIYFFLFVKWYFLILILVDKTIKTKKDYFFSKKWLAGKEKRKEREEKGRKRKKRTIIRTPAGLHTPAQKTHYAPPIELKF